MGSSAGRNIIDICEKKNFHSQHKNTITNSQTLSETKIPVTIVKAQAPSNPNQ